MARLGILRHACLFILLTLLTQIGGIAWLAALRFRRRVLTFVLAYAMLWGLAFALVPSFGREPLPCFGAPLQMQSPIYCALLRNYVMPDLAAIAHDAATEIAQVYPGTVTLALDGGFPFLSGMPLMPHLSHDDGEKLDFAFYYINAAGAYLPGKTRSPIGYFAFENGRDVDCNPVWLTLRWDMGWLQPLWPNRPVDDVRTAALIKIFAADPRVGKIFVEPPLATRLDLTDPKIRFQGCRAARHDDHIHIQL